VILGSIPGPGPREHRGHRGLGTLVERRFGETISGFSHPSFVEGRRGYRRPSSESKGAPGGSSGSLRVAELSTNPV
jgi:hypothetical protein